MKKNYKIIIFVFFIVVLLFLAGCCASKCAKMDSGAGGDAIKIGALFNLTGAQASLDKPGLDGFRLAADEINREGGLLGRKIEVVSMDGKTDQKACAEAAVRMIEQDKVIAIAGLADSDYALAAGAVAQQAGVLFLSSGATLPILPEVVGDRFFMAAFGDDIQAHAAADFSIRELKAKSAWVLTDQKMDFTKSLSKFFIERFEKKGGTIAAEEIFQTSDLDFSAQIERLSKMTPQPDVLFVSSGPSTAGVIIRQIRGRGIATPIVSGDGFDTPLLLISGGADAGSEVYFATHASMSNQSKKVQKFVKAYKAAYNREPENAFAALGYDSMRLLADAIKRADTTESDAIRKALARTHGFSGVTGRISYKHGKRVPNKSVSILTISRGKFEFVKEVHPE